MKTVSYILPSFLADYLVNDDESNLDDHEIDRITFFLQNSNVGKCISSHDCGFYRNHDIFPDFSATDCMVFTFQMKD